MIERFNGPTPNGGSYMLVSYFDVNKSPVDKNNATIINIKEFDDNDIELMETWGTTSRQKLNTNCKQEEKMGKGKGSCGGIQKKELLSNLENQSIAFLSHGSNTYRTRFDSDIKPSISLKGLPIQFAKDVVDELPVLKAECDKLSIPMIRNIETKPASSLMYGSGTMFAGKLSLNQPAIAGEYRSKNNSISKWTPKDSIVDRPEFAAAFADKNTLAKYYIMHEFAHHITQTYGHTTKESFESGINPLEAKIEKAFMTKNSISPSGYADINHFEWFAENYALYKMGRNDLVSPEVKNIINDIEHNERKHYDIHKENSALLSDAATSIQLNRQGKCKRGTVDETFKCSDEEPLTEKEPERWKVSQYIANLDVGFDVHLPEKTARMAFKQGTKFNDKLLDQKSHSPGVQGLTAHGENGPEIWYNKITGAKFANDEGIYKEALHELGHSLEYPYKTGDKFTKLSMWKYITPEKLQKDLISSGYDNTFKGIKIDMSDPGETWADLFEVYNNPRTHLMLRESLPSVHSQLVSMLGKSDYDIEIPQKEKLLFNKIATKGWNLKQSDLKELGITQKQYDEVSDLISPTYKDKPSTFIPNNENGTYNTRMNKIKEMFIAIPEDVKIARKTERAIRETTTNLSRAGITNDERKAVTRYKLNNYSDINNYLRKGIVFGDTAENKSWIEDNIKNIDSLMEKSKLTDDITTYRYVSNGYAESVLLPNVGKTVHEPGYMSTSYLEGVAKTAGNGNGAYMTIDVPKGTGIADLDSLATGDMMEYEVLLERGLDMTVEKHEKRDGMDWFKVKIENR